MSTRTIGRMVGALILVAFLAYGGGSALVDSASGASAMLSEVASNQLRISAGVLLILLNSAVVTAIGVLAFPVLSKHDEIAAYAYLVTRVFEAVILAVGALGLLLLVPLSQEYAEAGGGENSFLPALARLAQDANQNAYTFAMIVLGLGSLMFCRVLLRARLVPRLLAIWGMVGYAIVGAGMMLEVLGYSIGLALWIPGGLFELALGVLLIARGFPERGGAVARSDSDRQVEAAA